MIALVRTIDGVFRVDVEAEVVFDEVEEAVDHEQVELELPRVVAASAAGATVVAVVDRRLALDGQALVRRAEIGPLVLDADFDPAVLRYLTALKLNEEEVIKFGVPELLLTHGSTGALLISRGVRERIPVRRIDTDDPTGAGDAFLAAYAWARAAGHRPVSAGRHAATTAARVLELTAAPAA